MRKRFLTIITLIMALVICVSSLSACKLITVDNKRDMDQVVATVQINREAPYEEIQKRDMIMGYLNYGYMYEQYYGYTRAQVFTMIIKNLIENRVYVQNAIETFDSADDTSIFKIELRSDKDKWDVDRYLDDDELIEAEYLAKKAINDLIDAYVEAEEEGKQDTIVEEIRTVPTGATNAEKEELTVPEKDAYIKDADVYKLNDSEKGVERRKAYNKVIKLLKTNELLGDSYKGNIEDTKYYKDTFKNEKETKLLEKYEDCIRKNIFNGVTFNTIKDAYTKKYNTQSKWDNTAFASALSSATTENPILVNGSNGKGYGYVYNLLLGVSDEQKTAIENISKDLTKEEKALARKEILDGTKIKDLRSSWILSGYDFDGTYFTGDYTLTSKENSFAFQGAVTKIKDADPEKDELFDKYRVDSVKEFTLDSFINEMEKYVYGENAIASDKVTTYSASNPSIYRKVNMNTANSEYRERINELLFAFSTDPGSLNTYMGYAIKPIPDGGNSEEYMQEFADAGRELLKMGDKSYIIVATDYGYHVMFYSQMFDGYGIDNLVDYLNEFYGVKTWETEFDLMKGNYEDYEEKDGFLYLLTESVISSKVTEIMTEEQTEIKNKYIYDAETKGVVKYESRYADLLA